jgi:hypothetical protein
VIENFMAIAKDTNGIIVVKKMIQIYSPSTKSAINEQSLENDAQKQQNSLVLLLKIQENVIDLV